MQRLLGPVLALLVVCQHTHASPRWVWNNTPQPSQFAQRRSAAVDGRNGPSFRSISARSYPENGIVTPGLYPYDFSAKPIDLGDGTSIGYAPHDTLPVTNGHSNGAGHPNHIGHGEEDKKTQDVSKDERYTTLDKLNRGRVPVTLPDPHSYSREMLGGLHPEEVFYADNNLMIIKGGGFHAPHEGGLQGNARPIKTSPVSNSLVDGPLSEQPTRVRPTEVFGKVPIPFRFVNGNLPVVVKGQPVQASAFRRTSPHAYTSAHSRPSIHRVKLTSASPLTSGQRLQTLQESGETLVAEASQLQPVVAHLTQKRSANPKVVHYHYQTRGGSSKPIVNYQVHADGQMTKGNLQISNLKPNRNSIPRTHKTKGVQQNFSELEDLATPSVGTHNPLIPTVQTPRLSPTPRLPISLRGDTDVNFLEPRPRENPLATRVQPRTGVLRPRKPQGNGRREEVETARFMEPRRRRPIRQRSLRPRV